MADIKAEVAELIATTKASDPKLHQALTLINSRLSSLYIELHPLIARGSSTAPSDTDAIDPPENFTLVSTGATLRFTWSEVLGAFQYEIRAGSEWASVLEAQTANQSAIERMQTFSGQMQEIDAERAVVKRLLRGARYDETRHQ